MSNRKKIRRPDRDQADAAARDAARQTRSGGPLRGTLDLSAAREHTPDDAPPVAARLREMFAQTFTTVRLDPCPHIPAVWESGSAIPVHWALWRPDRAACEECFEVWCNASGQYCDLCHEVKPTDYMQLAQGAVIIHADVCDDCKAATVW